MTEQQEEALLSAVAADSAEEHSQEALDMVSISDDPNVIQDGGEVTNDVTMENGMETSGADEVEQVIESIKVERDSDTNIKMMDIDEDGIGGEETQIMQTEES